MGACRRLLLFGLTAAIAGCGDKGPGTAPATAGRVPLPQVGIGTYKGLVGGLYPAGANVEPAAHAAAGQSRARSLVHLDTSGVLSTGAEIVLLSLGMSNTTQEFCSGSSTTTNCSSWSFMGQAAADPSVNHTTLAIVNGARGGQDAQAWDATTDANYDTVRLNRLGPLGLTERQVQIVWVKQADAGPQDSLPSAQSDAYQLESRLGNIARALRSHYPNLRIIFFSSRIYAGYATTTLNPEPFAYESGFAVKWLIQAQIEQMSNGRDGDRRARRRFELQQRRGVARLGAVSLGRRHDAAPRRRSGVAEYGFRARWDASVAERPTEGRDDGARVLQNLAVHQMLVRQRRHVPLAP